MQLLLHRGIVHMQIKLRFLRYADSRDLLKEAARGFVQPHGSFPAGNFVDGGREMRNGIVQPRRRAVAAGAVRDH